MTAPAKTPGLYAKIVQVMNDVGPVKKTGYNAFHKYHYLKEEDIINAVRPLLAKHGVAIIPQVLEETVSVVTNARGNEETLCRLRVEFTFVDVDTSDSFSVITVGHGVDPGDKAAYKALTGALKYCLRQLLMISEGGDDPEADEGVDERRSAPTPRRRQRTMPRTDHDEPMQSVFDDQDAGYAMGPEIGASNIEGIRPGGRTDEPTKAQLDALRNIYASNRMTPIDMATMVMAINGDRIDVTPDTDGPTAAMAIQTYLKSTTGKKVAALIEGIQASYEPVNEEADIGSVPVITP